MERAPVGGGIREVGPVGSAFTRREPKTLGLLLFIRTICSDDDPDVLPHGGLISAYRAHPVPSRPEIQPGQLPLL